ncbi:MAG: hypothetical protein ABSE63_12455 [Thermoguttaceae bacterium]|jgi:hypothetical protein
MTTKDAIIHSVEELPPECLDELAAFLQKLRLRAANHNMPMALASENVLAQDWLSPEEDAAWRDL